MHYILKTDGGSRGNPGISAGGAVLYDATNMNIITSTSEYYGIKTNNQAEYMALKMGLTHIRTYLKTALIEDYTLTIQLDSELLVRQLNGIYKVKNKDLYALLQDIYDIIPIHTTIEHIKREYNTDADKLVNDVLDRYDIR